MTKVFVICMAFMYMVLPGVSAAGSLTDNSNGTVTDSGTLLTWQQCSAGQSGAGCATGTAATYAWEAAISYCEALSLGGFTDWRLPNHKELLSLVDYMRYNPSINTTFFPNVPNANFSAYWSSTTYASNTPYAWVVGFDNGTSGYNLKAGSVYYVRCVRGGQ